MPTTPATAPRPWGEHPLPAEGTSSQISIGPLTLWYRREKNEVWLAHGRAAPDSDPDEARTPPEDWARWAFADHPTSLRITPVMPDRLLVVKPELSFMLLRRARARIYARVPIWVRVEAVTGLEGATLLTELPTIVLSDTWWGDYQEGELGFWLPTKARRELTPDLFETHMVIATLQLTNRSEDDLPVEKLALRVVHLSMFEDEGRLWAEEVKVDYRGASEGSDIRMDDHPPQEADGAKEISAAREKTSGFSARTFQRLRALSGWGG